MLDNVEQFFFRLQGKVVNGEQADKVVQLNSRNDTFSVKSLYVVLESRSSIPFLIKVIWNP